MPIDDVTRRFETPKGRPPYGIWTVEPSAALVQRWEGVWRPVVMGAARREVPAGMFAPSIPFRWARVPVPGGCERERPLVTSGRWRTTAGGDAAEIDEYGYTVAESNRCLSTSDREVEWRIATAMGAFYESSENYGYVFDFRDGSRMHGDVYETRSAEELESMRVAEECHRELMAFIVDTERARDARVLALATAYEELAEDRRMYRFDHRDGSLVHRSVHQGYSREEKNDMECAEDEMFDRMEYN